MDADQVFEKAVIWHMAMDTQIKAAVRDRIRAAINQAASHNLDPNTPAGRRYLFVVGYRRAEQLLLKRWGCEAYRPAVLPHEFPLSPSDPPTSAVSTSPAASTP